MASAPAHRAPAHSGTPLDEFYRECLRVGCLGHLRHADLYLRGREELLVVVKGGAGGESTYLLGCYQRYNWPYVWRREGRAAGAAGGGAAGSAAEGGGDLEQDLPMELESTSTWVEGQSHVWDIVEELVRDAFKGAAPSSNAIAPANAFAVDLPSLRQASRSDGGAAAGALAAFLRAVLVARGGRAPKGVREDLAEVLRLHFRHLPAMASGALAGAGEGVTSQEARH